MKKRFVDSPSNVADNYFDYLRKSFISFLRGLKFYVLNHFVLHIPSGLIRTFLYRNIYKFQVSKKAAIHINVKFFGKKVTVGDWSVINSEALIDGRGGCIIGSNVSISRRVTILTMGHDYNDKDFMLKGGEVKVGDDVWIGYGAMIMPGVTIGKGAVIGAGSVVVKDVGNYMVVAGNPAKHIKNRDEQIYGPVYYQPFFWRTIVNEKEKVISNHTRWLSF